MKHRQWKFTHIALICIMPLFTACGGEEKSNCSFGDLVTSFCLNAIVEQASTGGSSGGGNASGGPIDNGGSSVPIDDGSSDGSGDSSAYEFFSTFRLSKFDEFETNDIFENANPVQFPTVSDSEGAFIRITGSVQENDDPSDFFIVTPNRSRNFAIALHYPCTETETCSELVVDDAVYLMAYDQNHNSIAGTPIGTVTEQLFAIEMTAGLPYYFAVHGYNTGEQPFPYTLSLSE